ncbi:MAG: peroxidase family protein [Pseudomonadota bacterium]
MAKMNHGLSRHDHFVKDCLEHHALNETAPGKVLPQTFGYLRKEGANEVTGSLSKKKIVDAFDKLVDSMKTSEMENGKADAGMTFLGQFIDHDVTLDAQSAIGTKIDPHNIRNVRTPGLDLDCVYGDGPEASPYLYSGEEGTHGFMLMGREGSPNDLPRNCHGRALIGDPRNDENMIVSQVQGAFIQLHNILMTLAEGKSEVGEHISDCAQMGIRSEVFTKVIPPHLCGFEEVRRFIKLHYQWIILNEFLPAFVDPDIIEKVLHHDPFHADAPIMPAEFTVACYRFGHATVQPAYKLRKGEGEVPLFTMKGFQPRGPEWDLEMAQFFDVAGTRAQKALPVGTKMADTLFELPDNIVGEGLEWGDHKIPLKQAKKLALRNILRDRTALRIASGQQLARLWGFDELDPPKELSDAHISKTPLWFYALQEAQEKGHGRLTDVGGTVVAGVLIRLLKLDPESVLNTHGFEPWSGFGDVCTMGNIMKYVEEHRDHVKDREKLYCGPSQEEWEAREDS